MPIVRGIMCDKCRKLMCWYGNETKEQMKHIARKKRMDDRKEMLVSGLYSKNESGKREVKRKRRNRHERGKRTDGHRQNISVS